MRKGKRKRERDKEEEQTVQKLINGPPPLPHPIKIYADRSPHPTAQPDQHAPSLPVQPSPSVVAYQAPVQVEQPPIPEIVPMRRGRPAKAQPASSTPHSTATSRTRVGAHSPQVRPTTSDPFAALDKMPAATAEELSSRFPSVEQFSLLHDSGTKFQFGGGAKPSPPDPRTDFNEGLAERLAEDAFARPSPANPELSPRPPGEFLIQQHESIPRGVTGPSTYARPILYEPQPKRPVMVSTGTMTSPSPSPSPPRLENLPQGQSLTTAPSSSMHDRSDPPQAYHPHHHHHHHHQQQQQQQQQLQQRPALLDVGPSATHIPISRQPSSSRPSLEIARALSSHDADAGSSQPLRSKSANSKPRPHSVYVESNLEFLRDLDSPSSQGTSTGGFPPIGGLRIQNSGQSITSIRSEHIDSNVDFLRAMEAEADAHKPEKRTPSGGFVSKHVKRASMPSISIPKPGVKNKLGGKFGDAFRRFERGTAGSAADPDRTPSPDPHQALIPAISGGQDTADEGDAWQVSSQDIPPEVKRELEKRQLSLEEKRVTAAAAEYKRQLENRGAGEGETPVRRNRANSIQKRVHALLNETKEPPPKTAEGYGKYTAEAAAPLQHHHHHHHHHHQQQQPQPQQQQQQQPQQPASPNGAPRTTVKQETYRITQSGSSHRPQTAAAEATQGLEPRSRPVAPGAPPRAVRKQVGSNSAPTPQVPVITQSAGIARPPPPPKPTKLRTGGSTAAPRSPVTPARGGGADFLDPAMGSSPGGAGAAEDWERSFAKRYPSLSGLEMVETVVGTGSTTRKA